MIQSLRIPALIGVSLLVVACGSNDSNASNDKGDGAVAGDSGTADTSPQDSGKDAAEDGEPDVVATPDSGKTDADGPACEAGNCIKVSTVSGSVVDENNTPLAGASATLCVHIQCGVSSCETPAKSGSDGIFKIVPTKSNECLEKAAYQLLPPAKKAMPTLYCTLNLKNGGDLQTHGTDRLVTAPKCNRAAPAQETELHEITAGNGTIVKIRRADIIGLLSEDFTYNDIQVLVWDSNKWGWPCFIDPSSPPNGLIGITPELEVPIDNFDAIHVAFKNDKNLAPGTKVDVMIVGAASTKTQDGTTIGEGRWQKATEAIVSADGKFIETEQGKGLPVGVWAGWVEKKK